jgi:hypothetical protein
MPCSYGSSGNIIKPNLPSRTFAMTMSILLYILQKYYLKKPVNFLKLYYDISFQEPKVNGQVVTSASQINTSTILLLLRIIGN